MSYNFERWKATQGEKTSPVYVRFSKCQMYISTALMKKIGSFTKFDLLVDRDKRVFALSFHKDGLFEAKTLPAQIGASMFVKEYGPVLCKRIPMKLADDMQGIVAWIGSLDGKVLK